MTLTHIVVFALLGVGGALAALRWPRTRAGLLLATSVVALFWLQPGTPIRNLSFWLPLATLAIVGAVWACVYPIHQTRHKTNLPTALALVLLVLLMGLLRLIELPFQFLAARPPLLWQILIGLVAVVALVLLAARAPLPAVALFVFLIGLFVVLKLEPLTQLVSAGLRALNAQNIAEARPTDMAWLGFSYIAFRLLHVLREKQNGKLVALNLREFICYVLFFPALTAGPIDRSDRFAKDLRAEFKLDAATATEALWRIFVGVFKKFAVADTLALIALNDFNAPHLRAGVWSWVVVYGYALRIYFDFSGYTDIAIGLGRWFGIKLPENFNNPYLKPNLTQFWNNWHITLAQWFRTYWFNPLTRNLRQAKASMVNRQAAIILLGQSSTMLLIALWHGISWNFVVWGIWHALGLFVHNRWADFAKSKGWATPRPWANALGAWVTFNFVALGWVWFALPTLPLSWGVFKKLIGL